MSEGNRPIIIKRKRGGGGHAHHGGAWKVAYADFVTAMMAFFLMMWLLNATNEEQRSGIADYFDAQIPILRGSGGGSGLFSGNVITENRDDAATGAGSATVTEGEAMVDGPGGDGGRRGADSDARALAALQDALDSLRDTVPGEDLLGHMGSSISTEGLMIEVFDTDGEPLFDVGSAEPTPMLEALIEMVAGLADLVTNDIAITGHTDGTPFLRDGQDANWALSLERAETARRLLVAAGLDPSRIVEVSGRAATQPVSDDPADPHNRRVAITLLRDLR